MSSAELGGTVPDLGAECNTPVDPAAPFTANTPYAEEKLRTCKTVASAPHGIYLSILAERVAGVEEASGSDPAYQRIRRFVKSNPEFFEVEQASAGLLASPTLELLDLINGGIIQSDRETGLDGRSWCRNLLGSIREVNDDGRHLLEQELQEYVDRTKDLRIVLQAEDPEAAPEYLTIPYKTRFTDSGRMAKQHAILSRSLEEAGKEYDSAVLATLTTNPSQHDSLLDAIENISTAWNRLMGWLSYDAENDDHGRPGCRPEYVRVLEFSEKGFPHLHVLFFLEDDPDQRMPFLVKKQSLSDYWGKYQGRIVDLQPLAWDDNLPEEYDQDAGWVSWSPDGDHGTLDSGEVSAGTTAGEYLGKYLSVIYGGMRSLSGSSSSSSPGRQETLVTDGGQPETPDDRVEEKAPAWKLALYWATNRRIRTMSRELRSQVEDALEDDQDDQLNELITESIQEYGYRFVGAYHRRNLPNHVLANGASIDALLERGRDPPPDAGDDPPTADGTWDRDREIPAEAESLLGGLTGQRPPE